MKRFIDINDVKYAAIKITFCFKGHKLDFNDITERMKLEPSYVRNENDFPEIAKKEGLATDIWELTSGYYESMSVAEEFEKFLDSLWDKIDIIKELKAIYNIVSSLTVSVQAWVRPYILISNKCTEFAYKINTEIDFDLYFYEAEGGSIPYNYAPLIEPTSNNN